MLIESCCTFVCLEVIELVWYAVRYLWFNIVVQPGQQSSTETGHSMEHSNGYNTVHSDEEKDDESTDGMVHV